MTFPTNPNRSVGLFPGQSMFQVSNANYSNGGLLDARKSFIGVINNILSQESITTTRASGVSTLNRSQTISKNLIWYRTDYSYGVELPLSYQYDYHVYSSTERNNLLLNQDILVAITNNQRVNVWVDTTNSDYPAWSIWTINTVLANEYITANVNNEDVSELLISYADTIFQVAQAYTVSVSTYAEMLLLSSLTNGDVIYVDADETADGFWTIYSYEDNSFNIVQAQAYRTSDFYSTIDWYAQDIEISGISQTYSANTPPMIAYKSESARDLTEGSTPTNIFVGINDGINAWYWTAWDTISKAWVTVALENGTIAFSDDFYNPSKVFFNPKAPIVSNVSIRDGSWELRVLTDILYYEGLLEPIEINETFFSLLHFVHVQQTNVDWAFKTNFMTVAGYQIPMIQSGIETTTVIDSLKSYIEEVKPYRVKVRNFEQQYSPETDIAYVDTTDFDKPVYYDPTLKAYRRLDPNNVTDVAILSTQEPWIDWYNNYLNNPNQIRKMNLTILFDRVTGYETEYSGQYGKDFDEWDAYDGTALDRIINHYEPLPGMTPADPATLMNLNFKGTYTDGGLMSQFDDAASDFDNTETGFDTVGFDTVVNSGLNQIVDGSTLSPISSYDLKLNAPQATDPFGYALRDPLVSKDHPEERMPLKTEDVLNLNIQSLALPGQAPQTTKFFDVSSYTDVSTVTLFFGAFAANSDSVIVWRDGVRISPSQYTLDIFARTITVNLLNSDNTNASNIVIKIFGIGGSDEIIETDYVNGNSNSEFTLSTSPTAQQVMAVINGEIVPSQAVAVSGNVLTIPETTQSSDEIAIYVFANNATTGSNIIKQETLPYTPSQSWVLNYPDNISIPNHVGTIVELNGKRLLPPLTCYGPFDITRRFLDFDVVLNNTTLNDIVGNIQVYVDSIIYPYAIPVVTAGTSDLPFGVMVPTGEMPDNSEGMFALYNQQLISLDPTFMADDVCLVIHQGNDFEILNNTLSLTSNVSMISSDVVTVTTFTNSATMDIKTYTYMSKSGGEYPIYCPNGTDYIWLTRGGSILCGDVNFQLTYTPSGFSGDGFGDCEFDLDGLTNTRLKLTTPFNSGLSPENPPTYGDWIVATVFTSKPAREQLNWISTTALPAGQRMVPEPDSGGYGMMPYDVVNFDEKVEWALCMPQYDGLIDAFENPVPTPVFKMRGWEYLRADKLFGGTLINKLFPTDTSITISLYDQNIASQLAPINPFAIPTEFDPGIIIIGGERIEYWDLTASGSTVVLDNLRRTTRGTSMADEQRHVQYFTGDGATTEFTINAVGTISDVYISSTQAVSFTGNSEIVSFNTGISVLAISAISVMVSGSTVDPSTYTVEDDGGNAVIVFHTAPSLLAPIIANLSTNIWQMSSSFAIETLSTTMKIIFDVAPAENTIVFVGLKLGNYYPVGTFVYNATQKFDNPIPVDTSNRNEDSIRFVREG